MTNRDNRSKATISVSIDDFLRKDKSVILNDLVSKAAQKSLNDYSGIIMTILSIDFYIAAKCHVFQCNPRNSNYYGKICMEILNQSVKYLEENRRLDDNSNAIAAIIALNGTYAGGHNGFIVNSMEVLRPILSKFSAQYSQDLINVYTEEYGSWVSKNVVLYRSTYELMILHAEINYNEQQKTK